MRIKFNGDAEVVGLKLHFDADSGERTLTPTLEVVVDRHRCGLTFGESFRELAFVSLAGEGLAYSSIKPGSVCEQHVVVFAGGRSIVTQPKIARVAPAPTECVRVTILVPIDFDAADVTVLAGCYGEAVRVKLEPAQLELPLGLGVHSVATVPLQNVTTTSGSTGTV